MLTFRFILYVKGCLCCYFFAGEYVEIITDFGGRVEDLQLESKSTGKLRKVLLTHNDNATAVLENKWWKGMLLLPWANRIAYVCFSCCILHVSVVIPW